MFGFEIVKPDGTPDRDATARMVLGYHFRRRHESQQHREFVRSLIRAIRIQRERWFG